MSALPRIDGDADTMVPAPGAVAPAALSAPSGTSLTGGDSALSTERAGDGPSDNQRSRVPAAEDRIGEFTLLKRIGEGGMGVVFAAWSHKLARRVAIKIPTRGLDDVVRARIVREAQSLAQVDHPNVVRVYEIGEDGARLFIAMELVEGVTLRKWQQQTPRGWREIVRMYLQAGCGLAAAHHQGLIHRDFKPSNILVDSTGRVRLIDFGLARMRDSSGDVIATATSDGDSEDSSGPEFVLTSRAGTPRYMAPELHDTGATVDARSDQYSFCVALWEALFGELPDWRRTLPAGAAPVPAWLHRALRRGLSLDRHGRYPTLDPLLAELEAGLQPPRRRPLAIAAGLAAVLAVGVGAAIHSADATGACADPASLAASLWPAGSAPEQYVYKDMSVRTWLSERALEWGRASATACSAGPGWDEATRARASRCLGEREQALRAIAAAAAAPPAPIGLEPAPAPRWDARLAVWDRALAPAADCVDPRYLGLTVEEPDSFDMSEITWLEDHLQTGAALALAGDPVTATRRLQRARGRADALGDRWRRARADLALGVAAFTQGDEAAARGRFEAAASDAVAAADDFLAADAWRWLVFIDAARDPEPTHALRLLPHAVSTLHRIGQAAGPRMLDLQLSAAWAELRLGDLDDAHQRLARALQTTTGVDEALAARVLRHHAEQAHQRDQHLPAVDLARQALSLQLRRDGPDARSVADTRQSLARYQLAAGQHAEAEANLRAALAVAATNPDARERASLELDLAVVLYTRDDLDAARAAAERAAEAFAAAPDPHAGRADRIALAKLRGDLSLESDDPGAALRSYQGGLALVLAGDDLPEVRDNAAAIRVGIAAAHHRLGDLAGAESALAPVLRATAELAPVTAAYALATAAELDLAGGERARAEARTQQALDLLDAADPMVPALRQLLSQTRAASPVRRK